MRLRATGRPGGALAATGPQNYTRGGARFAFAQAAQGRLPTPHNTRASSGAVKRRWREELAAASAEESASSSDDADADATAELARWCREQRRTGRADAGAALQASQRDPRRFLSTLGASNDGRAFLLSLVRRRQRELAAAADAPRRAARAHAALGSLHEHLGELEPAI